MATELAGMALVRFGPGRGYGLVPLAILLAVVGAIVWMLTQAGGKERPKE